jgi:hypothetical protein
MAKALLGVEEGEARPAFDFVGVEVTRLISNSGF